MSERRDAAAATRPSPSAVIHCDCTRPVFPSPVTPDATGASWAFPRASHAAITRRARRGGDRPSSTSLKHALRHQPNLQPRGVYLIRATSCRTRDSSSNPLDGSRGWCSDAAARSTLQVDQTGSRRSSSQSFASSLGGSTESPSPLGRGRRGSRTPAPLVPGSSPGLPPTPRGPRKPGCRLARRRRGHRPSPSGLP
jgi:hypothetical protein